MFYYSSNNPCLPCPLDNLGRVGAQPKLTIYIHETHWVSSTMLMLSITGSAIPNSCLLMLMIKGIDRDEFK